MQKGGRLTLVSTPIGNLGDISARAVEALERADLILCEDTRHSAKLLRHLNIATPTAAYHDHSDERARERYLGLLEQGQQLALISDAGTPLISDPGYKLVAQATQAGYQVTATPGPSAPIMALSISGLPSNRFLFEGFLPAKQVARHKALAGLKSLDATLLFFESGGRLGASLADMLAVLGERDAAVARELTKAYEEVVTGTLAQLSAKYASQENPPKGEIVVVVGPPIEQSVELDDETVTSAISTGLAEGERVKELASRLAEQFDLPKKDLYNRIQAIKDQGSA